VPGREVPPKKKRAAPQTNWPHTVRRRRSTVVTRNKERMLARNWKQLFSMVRRKDFLGV